jgi:hypothetical protein
MEEIPTPDFAVPYAAPMLAKTKADVTPIKPKNGADAGHVSISTLMIYVLCICVVVDVVICGNIAEIIIGK